MDDFYASRAELEQRSIIDVNNKIKSLDPKEAQREIL